MAHGSRRISSPSRKFYSSRTTSCAANMLTKSNRNFTSVNLRSQTGACSAGKACLCLRRASSSSMALQPGVGLGLLYNTPPSLSIPCSVSPIVYSHLSQVRGRHPAISFLVLLIVLLHTAFRTSFSELRCVAFFPYDQAIVFFGLL